MKPCRVVLYCFVCLALACVLSLPVHAQGAPPVDLAVDLTEGPDGSVLVTGATPESPVGLVFLNRTVDAFGARVRMGTEILTADAVGEVTFTPEGGVARVSSWVAVDLSAGDGAGRTAQASPTGFAPKPRALPAEALERGSEGQLRRLRRDGQIFYTALLRPGADVTRGAWTLLLEDGGAGDEDGRGNGRIVFQPESADPVGSSPVAPLEFLGGDVLVMTHPRTFALTVVAVRDTGPPQDLTHALLGLETAEEVR